MRFTAVIAASLVAPLVAAHGGIEGAPRFFGLPKDMRARNPFAGHQVRHAAQPVGSLQTRQEADPERCGTQGGNQICASDKCCSVEGYCGTTKDHCQAPDCQFNFGPACDANKTPNGATTRNDVRRQLGSVEYGGAGIYSCNNPGTVAITYDDGPYIYTEGVLKLFKDAGFHATFFLTGNNIGKGSIDENWAGVIKQMYNEGHQVASHTWSHQDLSKITEEEVYDQMVKNEMAIRNILGKYPTYMRPPYSSCEATCQNVMTKLGYVISYFDLDTSDYLNLTPVLIQNAKDLFKYGIDQRNNPDVLGGDGDKLAIAHDIHELSAVDLTTYMIQYLKDNNLRGVTMGECLNDPEANWYRDSTPASPSASSTRSSSAPVASPTGPTSADGNCGSSTAGNGQSCIGFVGATGLLYECCSQYGFCGNSADHCGTSCQPGFGKCGAQPSASPSVAPTSSATGPVPTPTGPTSTDGFCGSSTDGKSQSCIGFKGLDGGALECCSQYGYCGSSADHCGTSCQPGFGKCGAQSSASSSAPVSSAPASSSSVASSTVFVSSSAVQSSVSISSSAVQSSVAASSSAAQSSSVHASSSAVQSSAPGSSSAAHSSSIYASSSVAPSSSYAASSVAHVSSSVVLPSASASASSGNYESASSAVSHVSYTGGYAASTSASVIKDSYPTSTPVGPSGSSIAYPSGSSAGYPAGSSSVVYPVGSSTKVSPASSTPCSSSTVAYAASSAPVYAASSAPVYAVSSVVIYKASTFSTAIVKASSTPCSSSTPAATPTANVSKDGKCGSANGGQTCVGYKTPFGETLGCCCRTSGKCSSDPWACSADGCDKGYGKCNTY